MASDGVPPRGPTLGKGLTASALPFAPSAPSLPRASSVDSAVNATPFVPRNLRSNASDPIKLHAAVPAFVPAQRLVDMDGAAALGAYASQTGAYPGRGPQQGGGRGGRGGPAGLVGGAPAAYVGGGRGGRGRGSSGGGGRATAEAAAAYYALGTSALGSAAAAYSLPAGVMAAGGNGGGSGQRPSSAFPSASAQASGYAAYGLVPPSSQVPTSYSSGASSLPSQRAHEQYAAGQGKAHVQARFMSEGLRQQLQQNAYLVQAQWSAEQAGKTSEDFPCLPDHVGQYHTLYPMEEPAVDGNDRLSIALGLRSFVFKAIRAHDGLPYAVRRICGKQVIPTSELLSRARAAVDAWAPVSNHPNMIGLRAAFVSSEMEDATASLFFAHDYHPGSVTLAQAHLVPSTSSSGITQLNQATETQMWSYLVQLTSVLRCVHNAGLSLKPGSLHPTKVLLTPFGRLRVGSAIGIIESLSPNGADPQDIEDRQLAHRVELSAVGQLLLTLACAGLSSTPSLDICAAHHSIELTRTLAALLASAEGGGVSSWRQLAGALADRTMEEMDGLGVMGNGLLGELEKECENGRLLRILIKLGFVNERPELNGDSQWSETGDRYLLKLFRDFVFHQTNEDGSPLSDWGHVVESLNKIDSGVPEKVLLLSRDEQNMMVVSYADLKACAEGAFAQVNEAAARSVQ